MLKLVALSCRESSRVFHSATVAVSIMFAESDFTIAEASDSNSTSGSECQSSSDKEHESSCSSTARHCQLPSPRKIKKVSGKGNSKEAIVEASDSDSTSDSECQSSSDREHESSCSSTAHPYQLSLPQKIKKVSGKGNTKGALTSHQHSGTGKFRSNWYLSSHITASTKGSRYACCKLCNSLFTVSHGGLNHNWGEVHWYLYLRTLKYNFCCTCTKIFINVL